MGDKSVFRVRPIQACWLRTRSQFFQLSAVRPFCKSVGVFLKVSTCTCIFDAPGEGCDTAAAPEFAAPVHSDKSSTSDGHRYRRLAAGSGGAAHLEAEHRLRVLELSNRSSRQDSAFLSKQFACWRREAKRARADLQLAEQDTIKHGKEVYLFSMRGGNATALRRNIKGGLVPRPSQISCRSILLNGRSCVGKFGLELGGPKQCEQFLDDAGCPRTDTVNFGIHCMMGDV